MTKGSTWQWLEIACKAFYALFGCSHKLYFYTVFFMFVTVKLCYEDGGLPIPRHREAMLLSEIPGWLILRDQTDNTVRRTTKIPDVH